MGLLENLSDESLVIRYQKNQDPVYLGELYKRFYDKVYHYCLRKMKNRADAYDVTTETFLIIAQKITNLRDPLLFIAWLFKIAHNLCMDWLKKGQLVVKEFNFLYLSDESNSEELAELILKEHLLNKLAFLLEGLEESTKLLLLDKYIKGVSIKDLEENYNLSRSAVKMRLLRGKRKLLKGLKSN